MDTEILSESYATMMMKYLDDVAGFAENVEEKQWASAASVVHNEEERAAVTAAAEKSGKYEFSLKGATFILTRKDENSEENTEENNIKELLEKGKHDIYTKGPGNPVEHLDGSTTPSHSKKEGIPLPWFEWDAVPIEEDVHTILADTVYGMIEDAAPLAAPEFAEQEIKPMFGKVLKGGDS